MITEGSKEAIDLRARDATPEEASANDDGRNRLQKFYPGRQQVRIECHPEKMRTPVLYFYHSSSCDTELIQRFPLSTSFNWEKDSVT